MSKIPPKGTEERLKLEKRFLEKYEVDEESGCWEWTAYTEPQGGYGVFKIGDTTELAHRAALLLLEDEELPSSRKEVVSHLCHNPSCVNTSHLKIGSQSENVQASYDEGDKIATTRGIDRCDGFDVDDIRRIRRLYNHEGWLQREIAEAYNVTQSMVSQILSGHVYGYVEEDN